MLRVHDRFTFDDLGQLDPTQGIRQEVTNVVTSANQATEAVTQTAKNANVTIENVGMAAGAGIAGAIIIFGSAMIPSNLKWSTYLKLAGIIAGAGIAIGGAAYAFRDKPLPPKQDAGVVPGAANLYVAPDIVLAADQGWKVFGTPRIDLTITNRTGGTLQLQVNAKDYIGSSPADNRLEMTWNPENMDLGPQAVESKSFYFVTDQIKGAPGPRTVVFSIVDRVANRVIVNWQKTVNFT